MKKLKKIKLMKNRKITDAIIEVLEKVKQSLSAKDIYSKIIELDLYKFKATDPYHVVLTQLRRHCLGLDFPSAYSEKYFKLLIDGTYDLKKKNEKSNVTESKSKSIVSVKQLKAKHENYLKEFKAEIKDQLRSIEPQEFEVFSKKLLEIYGFIDMSITKMSRV